MHLSKVDEEVLVQKTLEVVTFLTTKEMTDIYDKVGMVDNTL